MYVIFWVSFPFKFRTLFLTLSDFTKVGCPQTVAECKRRRNPTLSYWSVICPKIHISSVSCTASLWHVLKKKHITLVGYPVLEVLVGSPILNEKTNSDIIFVKDFFLWKKNDKDKVSLETCSFNICRQQIIFAFALRGHRAVTVIIWKLTMVVVCHILKLCLSHDVTVNQPKNVPPKANGMMILQAEKHTLCYIWSHDFSYHVI